MNSLNALKINSFMVHMPQNPERLEQCAPPGHLLGHRHLPSSRRGGRGMAHVRGATRSGNRCVGWRSRHRRVNHGLLVWGQAPRRDKRQESSARLRISVDMIEASLAGRKGCKPCAPFRQAHLHAVAAQFADLGAAPRGAPRPGVDQRPPRQRVRFDRHTLLLNGSRRSNIVQERSVWG